MIDVNVNEISESFFQKFSRDNFNRLLTQEAPREIRERKKRGIKEFYDLYVELLFGEGKRDYKYETTLFDDSLVGWTATFLFSNSLFYSKLY